MNDEARSILKLAFERRSRVIGLLIGVIAGIIAVFCGFGKALAFSICVLVGYGLGRIVEEEDLIRSLLSSSLLRRRR
ncbi:MAG: DUF2273 domain-containing protein [Bacillota bacterium]|jgi:uncharacterized membrane protein|nr:DUF2273 domain-containing protein [Bacillota bacterium]HOB91251.1 DUF2273 domain-containing protein [Bacillota bacterium]HPZ53656.1 DUF2273 domain-containing protein [Bacillota bacterium]HQD17217.1 DUF2273 domain-containing protein [Bacillota bacterium]